MFSIVMPTFNRSVLLARTMDAILAMRGIENCEVIVVDDGSADDTTEVLKALAAKHPFVKPLRQQNGGIASARNLAIRHAQKDWLLCMDDDVLPVPELLEAHGERLKSGFDVSQGDIVWDESLLSDPLIQYIERMGMQFRLSQYKDGDVVSYQNMYTANVAFPAADARELGGLDDSFNVRRYGFDDIAFAWKLSKRGRKIGFAARAKVFHLHPWTEESLLRRENSIGFNLAQTGKLYPEMAKDLGYERVAASYAWMLPLVGTADRIGVAGLFGRDFARRVAVKHSFLRGFRDGMVAMREEAK